MKNRDLADARPRGKNGVDHSDVQPFLVRSIDDIESTEQADIVQSLYGKGHLIAKVGAPNAGKTALGIDHGLHVAAGEVWFDMKVSGGPVIYFAPEAPASVIIRAKAAVREKFSGRKLPFYIATGTPELGDAIASITDTQRMIATIRSVESEEGRAVKLVQIDTLASCLGNGDENSDGMLRLVVAAKYIATFIDCAVMLIHHPSKADASGLRGHGSLAAACDSIITITVDEVSGMRTATLVKSRDSATGIQWCYTLEPVSLPEPDGFGDPRTTIIVKPVHVTRARPRPSGKRQQALLAELERRYRTGESGWSEAVIRETGRTIGIKPQSARDAVRGLCIAGYLWGQPDNFTLKYPPTESTK